MKQVLIVDDDESMRLVLSRILESIPELRVSLADGGEETLWLVKENTYDLILLDLLMPGVGGIEVLTRIRKASPNRETPVIIVSLMADPATQIVCRSLGVTDYVVKPFGRDAVIRAVKGALHAATDSA